MKKFCVNCVYFEEAGCLCTRDMSYDLVYGRLVEGDAYDAITERYPSSEKIAKIHTVVSNYRGPCGSDAVYFKEQK